MEFRHLQGHSSGLGERSLTCGDTGAPSPELEHPLGLILPLVPSAAAIEAFRIADHKAVHLWKSFDPQ
jgi:hypothetical protein